MAKPMPPDCATTAIRFLVASSGTWPGLMSTVGLKVAATFCTSLMKPSALGPEMRMPVRFAIATIWSCMPAESPPSSAKPEEMITAFFTPAAAHSSSAPTTARAGMMITARSTGAPISAIAL